MIRHRIRDWKAWAHSAPNGERTRRRRRPRLLEGLENRTLLSATIYTVDLTSDTGATNGTDAGDLLFCITQANANTNSAGSEIQFSPSLFTAATPQTITLSSTLDLTEADGPEKIDGPGASIVTISGNNAVQVFNEPDEDVTATLAGLTIFQGMTNGFGGGINNNGTLTVTACTIESNSAQGGAGIYNDGTLTVTGCEIESNSAAGVGGGIDNDSGTLTITNTTFASNSAVSGGGGIMNKSKSTLNLTGSALADNSAVSGGGIENNNSMLTVTGSTFAGNESTGTQATAGGGGIDNAGGTASVTSSTLSGNAAVVGGGGIYQSGGALTITGSTLSDNSVSGPGGPGGGIDENAGTMGTLTITNSTIAGNSAQGLGAGIQENTGALLAVNCTIAYNVETASGASGLGGGMDITQGPVTLDNTLIALNTDGPGLGAPADNLFSDGEEVSPASQNNLIGTGGDNSGLAGASNGNQLGVAIPGFGALADNGGPTETIALLANSPAINAGNNALAVDPGGNPLSTDQRGAGFPRIVNGTVDIGAFERPIVTASPMVYTVDLTSDTGAGSGTEGDLLYVTNLVNANTSLAGSEIKFSPTVFASPQTITLTSPLELGEPSGPETIVGPGASLVTVSGNKADQVFDVLESDVVISVSGLTISDGSASSGAGIGNSGTLAVSGCTISDNEASDGGGIDNGGVLTVTNCAISGNFAEEGGGIDNSGTLTISDSTISEVTDAGTGGGIDNDGTLTAINCTISGNSASSGAGIYNGGTLTVTGCTIASNSAVFLFGGEGGGIDNLGTAVFTNSTVAGNFATYGGGIYNQATLTVVNCTIADNSIDDSTLGGGIYCASQASPATAILNNTIVDLNTSAFGSNDIQLGSGGSASGAYNLIGTGGSGGLMNGIDGNQVGVATPDLGALADNGGPTQTIALLAGSLAINNGKNSLAVDANGNALATDQRGPGYVRIFGVTVDIGAFELQPVNPVPSLTSISPNTIQAGQAGPITLTVSGSSFVSDSVVDWNGTALATTFGSSTSLTATIPASDLASPGNDSITVINPPAGGGTSTAATFQVLPTPGPTPTSTPPVTVTSVHWEAIKVKVGTGKKARDEVRNGARDRVQRARRGQRRSRGLSALERHDEEGQEEGRHDRQAHPANFGPAGDEPDGLVSFARAGEQA